MTSLAFELHAHLIYEQGGYIQHFGNDDLVACFDCHKDEDAQEKLNQAWKCAQEIQASIEKEADLDGLQVGIGISVGEVTSKITSGHHCGYLMVGNAVKEAAHLSQQAGAGGIMVNTPCATSSPSEE
jgi:class 3 adenylate cyclase